MHLGQLGVVLGLGLGSSHGLIVESQSQRCSSKVLEAPELGHLVAGGTIALVEQDPLYAPVKAVGDRDRSPVVVLVLVVVLVVVPLYPPSEIVDAGLEGKKVR